MDAATPNGDATPAGFLMRPIGVVRNSRTELIDDGWDLIDSRIELDLSMLDGSATDGLMDFSHVEVVFVFHRVDEADIERGARHPRATRTGRRSGSWRSARRCGPTASARRSAS